MVFWCVAVIGGLGRCPSDQSTRCNAARFGLAPSLVLLVDLDWLVWRTELEQAKCACRSVAIALRPEFIWFLAWAGRERRRFGWREEREMVWALLQAK